jgi:hypothetical protein
MSNIQDLVNELQIQARACRQVSQNSSWALLCERAADAIEARGRVIESAVDANLELQVQRSVLLKALADAKGFIVGQRAADNLGISNNTLTIIDAAIARVSA